MTGFVILIVAILLALMAMWSLLYWWGKSSHKVLLSSLVLNVMLLLGLMVGVANNAEVDHPLVNLMSLAVYVLILTIPPTMYLYVEHYLSKRTLLDSLRNRLASYFLPIALLLVNTCAFVLIYSSDPDAFYVKMTSELMTYANLIAVVFVFLLQNAYFIFQAFSRYRDHAQEVDEVFAQSEGVILRWVRTFIWGYLIFIMVLYLRQLGLWGSTDLWFALFVFSFFSYVLYMGLRIPSFSTTHAHALAELDDEHTKKEEGNNIKPLKIDSPELVPPELQADIWSKVIHLMEAEYAYLNPSLTLYALAKQAETNSKYLRYIIKAKGYRNFSAFINHYRIAEACRLLADPEQRKRFTIDSIGEQAGFKSKSAFYQSFKLQTGLTPRQFQQL